MWSEYPEGGSGAAGEDASEDSLPLAERVHSKNWRTRQNAFGELKQEFATAEDGDDVVFREYAEVVAKGMKDANAMALEAAVEAALVFVDRASNVGSVAPRLFPTVVEKGLVARPSTKVKVQELLLLLIEVEQGETVVSNLLSGAKHKVPKLACACSSFLLEAIRAFGVQPIPVKETLRAMEPLFESATQSIRQDATDILGELHRFLGPQPLDQYTKNLRASQLEQVQAAYAKCPQGSGQPSRYTRSEQKKGAGSSSSAGPSSVSGNEGASSTVSAAGPSAAPAVEIDPLQFVDPVDVATSLPGDIFERLAASKWSDKAEALALIAEATKVPKILPGDFHELVNTLKKLLTNVNIKVVVGAAEVLNNLACGLRADFRPYARGLVPACVDKLKDKKSNVRDACRAIIESSFQFGAITVADCMEDLTEGINHKVPQVQEETMRILSMVTARGKESDFKGQIKPLIGLLLQGTDRAQESTRDLSFKALANLMVTLGENRVMPHLSNLEKVKLAKVQDFFAAAGGASGSSSTAVPGGGPSTAVSGRVLSAPSSPGNPPPMSSSSSRPTSAPSSPAGPSSARGPVSARGGGKKVAPARAAGRPRSATGGSSSSRAAGSGSSAPKANAARGQGQGPPVVAVDEEEEVSGALPCEEEAMENLRAHCPSLAPSVWPEFLSAEWKQRKEAMEQVLPELPSALESLAGNSGAQEMATSSVAALLLTGFKDSNLLVMQLRLQLTRILCDFAMSKLACRRLALACAERMHEAKLSARCLECLTSLSESSSPRLVLHEVFRGIKGQKSPKATETALQWCQSAVEDFGAAACNMPAVVEFMQEQLENVNAAVRKAVLSLLCVVRAQVPQIRKLFRNLRSAVQTVVDETLDKWEREHPDQVAAAAAAPPKRAFREQAVDGNAGNTLDSLLPRKDITNEVTGRLEDDLQDKNWKTRLAAVQEIQEILKGANGCATGKIGGLMQLLKQRVLDQNITLVFETMTLVAELARSFGEEFSRYAKVIVPNLLVRTGDNKRQVSQAAIACMDAIGEHVPMENLIPFFGKALASPDSTPNAKVEFCRWMLKNTPSLYSEAVNVGPMVKPLLGMLSDRSADIRKLASDMMVVAIHRVGLGKVQKAVRDLKPAIQNSLAPIIEDCASKPIPEGIESTAASGSTSIVVGGKRQRLPGAVDVDKENRPNSAVASTTTTTTTTTTAGGAATSAPSSARARSMSANRSRPGSASGVSAAASSAPGEDMSANVVDGPPLLANPEQKEQRARREKKLKWAFEEPRKEFLDMLREQLVGVVTEPILERMMSNDFKQYNDVLSALIASMGDQQEELIQSLDVLLKWLSLRMFDSNTSTLIKSIEFADRVFELLEYHQYQLSDYESYLFLPYFVDKMGNNNGHIRKSMKKVLQGAHAVCNHQKLFNFLIRGLDNKNSKTRVDCLEELNVMAQKFELRSVCANPRRVIAAIATHLKDRDSAVRHAVLSFMETCYVQLGDQFWDSLKNLPEPHSQMIEDRLKFSQPQSAPAESGTLPSVAAASMPLTSSGRPASAPAQAGPPAAATVTSTLNLAAIPTTTTYAIDYRQLELQSVECMTSSHEKEDVEAAVRAPSPMNLSAPRATAAVEQAQGPFMGDPVMNDEVRPSTAPSTSAVGAHSLVAPTPQIPTGRTRGNSALRSYMAQQDNSKELGDLLAELQCSEDDSSRTEVLKLICGLLNRSEDPEIAQTIISRVDDLVDVLKEATHEAFERRREEFPVRVCKYVFNTLMQLFARRHLACKVTLLPQQSLITELLKRLLDENLTEVDEGSYLLRALNTLMLKILENSDRTQSFKALITVLGDSLLMQQTMQTEDVTYTTKYGQLVVKCVMRLIKSLDGGVDMIDIAGLLEIIHQFFKEYPPASASRNGEHTQQHRAIKTLLSKMVEILGEDIRSFMLADCFQDPKNFVVRQVELFLVSKMKREGSAATTTTASSAELGAGRGVAVNAGLSIQVESDDMEGPVSGGVAPVTSDSPSENPVLRQIFEMIKMKASTKKGLAMLYQYRKNHADVDLSPFLSAHSEPFQAYILRQLQRHEDADTPTASATPTTATTASTPSTSSTNSSSTTTTPAEAQIPLSEKSEESSLASSQGERLQLARSGSTASTSERPRLKLEAIRARLGRSSAHSAATPSATENVSHNHEKEKESDEETEDRQEEQGVPDGSSNEPSLRQKIAEDFRKDQSTTERSTRNPQEKSEQSTDLFVIRARLNELRTKGGGNASS